jgi:8-oxo-dGTP pyrophosphatase MutT (NUDIX family)
MPPPLEIGRLADYLRGRLAEPLPGADAHLRMVPPLTARREAISVEGKDCVHASVLVLIVPVDEQPGVVLTVRHAGLRSHSGQISFPGGRIDAGEDAVTAALREAYEEIGVYPDAPDVLGTLSRLYIPPSNFCVTPVVAVLASRPRYVSHEAEVEAVLEVPLATLLAAETRGLAERQIFGQAVQVPCFRFAGHEVWGATAMMLAEFAAVITE